MRRPYVFVSNLSDLITDSDFPKLHTSMLAGKPSPIVEEFEGKIYVLSGYPWQSYCLLPTPTFEVYDPLIEHEMCTMRPVSIIPNLSLESLPDGEDPPPRTNSIYGHFQGRETTFLLSQSSWSQATQDC